MTTALFHAGIVVFMYALSGFSFAIECPDGWVTYHLSCYLFARDHFVTFTEAEHYCQQRGGHLVKVDSKEENLFIKDFLSGMKDEEHWMGLTDELAEGVWKWFPSNAVANYTDWDSGQPNSLGNEDCACFLPAAGYRWHDISCEKKLEPICETESMGSVVVG